MTRADSLDSDAAAARRIMTYWGIAFFAGTFGTAAAAMFLDLGSALSISLFMASMLLLIPFVRASERCNFVGGTGSTATRRYNRRFLLASFAYVVTLMTAVWLTKIGSYPTPVYIMIALAPSVPVGAMIWAIGRLLKEEEDEYLKSRHVYHALVATGFVLVLTTVWGFLEQFNVVPHVPTYIVFPAWAVGLGFSQIWSLVRS